MSDYTPKIITSEGEIRNFFTPPVTYEDITKAEMLLRIESVEEYVIQTYFDGTIPSSSKARIATLLLIAADLALDPRLSKKYHTLNREKFTGDYEYVINSKGFESNVERWTKRAIELLNTKKYSSSSLGAWNIRKVN